MAAGLSGGAFLTYNKDTYPLLMALSFGAALLCYAITVYLLMHSSEAGNTSLSQGARPRT